MVRENFYEDKAEEFLRLKGYRILERNFNTRWGEIDIVAKDKHIFALIEVKARGRDFWVSPQEAVDESKRRRLVLTGKLYAKRYPQGDYRFDVVAIEEGKGWRSYYLIKNAFLENEKIQR